MEAQSSSFAASPSSVPTHVDGGQYLTLRLGDEEYAIDILRVQEIRSYEVPTKMVNSPVFVKGVVNLRGVIVSIVDLRLKLQMAKAEYTDFTVVIILHINGTVIGAVVDSVSDVVTLSSDDIKPAPQFESAIDARFIRGIVHLGERTLIVINIETLLSNAELGMVAAS
ncbi:MAG: chemotaxis protein CheW [Rhodoferax sp.]|nr:chemotaxis protein CheW [Rhodoferax sp.]